MTGIGGGFVIFHPEIVFLPRGCEVNVAVGHGDRHNAAPALDKDLLKVEVVSGPTHEKGSDRERSRGSPSTHCNTHNSE